MLQQRARLVTAGRTQYLPPSQNKVVEAGRGVEEVRFSHPMMIHPFLPASVRREQPLEWVPSLESSHCSELMTRVQSLEGIRPLEFSHWSECHNDAYLEYECFLRGSAPEEGA